MNDAERFFTKVDKTATCWNWIGGRNKYGYGVFWLKGKQIRAHHFLVLSDKPKNKWVLHKCDNRACVNPAHLFFGTAKDNTADMHRKGRGNPLAGWRGMMRVRKIHFGEQNHKSKLSESNVREILNTPIAFGFMSRLAKKFGVTHECIRKVVQGRSWRHLTAASQWTTEDLK